MSFTRAFALSALLLAVACGEKDPYDSDSSGDDTAPGDDTDATDDSATEEQNIEGSWLSEGDNVSDLLQLFNITSITADFQSDGSYEVVSTDSGGTNVTYSGTYVVDISTSIPTITISQTQPSAATAQGIWQVEGTTLTYEVIQTDPNPGGFVPPTPEGGFGSSSGPNLAAGANVQVFVAQ